MPTNAQLHFTPPLLPVSSPFKPWQKPPAAAAVEPLDTTVQNCTFPYSRLRLTDAKKPAWRRELDAKKRRAKGFQRAMSGLRVGGRLYLVTLTNARWSRAPTGGIIGERDSGNEAITRAFRAYVMRLRRRGWLLGYMKVREYTKRGRPHLHLLLRLKPGVSEALLRLATTTWWAALFDSPVVDVAAVYSPPGAASYLAKYLGKDPQARYSWSWDWVWKGFVADWRGVLRLGLGSGLALVEVVDWWGRILDIYARTGVRLHYSQMRVCFGAQRSG